MAAAKTFPLDDSIKTDIAGIVGMFWFAEVPAGNCVPRACVGKAVLAACGIQSRLVAGSMLLRAGPLPVRDTLRFALPNNRGGFYQGVVIGHVWNECEHDLIDFSAGDWEAEAALMYATATDPADLALGPLDWQVEVPAFIWQAAGPLKAAWREQGEPAVGGLWYGGWSGRIEPTYSDFDPIVRDAKPHIAEKIAELRLRERIADHGI
jgi:hypothetical protein